MNRKGRRIVFFVFSALFVQALARSGQAGDLAQWLSGKPYPLTVRLKDLGREWRRVVIHGNAGASGNIEVNINGSTQGSTSQNNLLGLWGSGRSYVTRGQTVSASGQTYLVVYPLPGTAMDLASLLRAALTKIPPVEEILTPETALRLSLLDVRTMACLEDVRVFDMDWEIAQSQEAAKKLANLIKAMAEANAPKPGKK
jgi:hypothetical protein